MIHLMEQRIPRIRKQLFLLLAASSLALALPKLQAQTTPTPPTFDVASIRENKSDQHARSHIMSSPHDGRFTTINVPLNMLLKFAFNVPESQISGIPSALGAQKFDIEARANPTIDAQLSKLDSDQGRMQKQLMIQALLSDRFKLTWHNETRQLPVFNLVAIKSGSKLPESKSSGRTFNTRHGQLDDQGITTAALADQLAIELGRPVIDKTALNGRYDIALKWTPDDGGTPTPDSPDSAPSLFTAIQEQLGLKLESTKGPVQVLVIDHIEEPSPN